jgi:hypothetical protein
VIRVAFASRSGRDEATTMMVAAKVYLWGDLRELRVKWRVTHLWMWMKMKRRQGCEKWLEERSDLMSVSMERGYLVVVIHS